MTESEMLVKLLRAELPPARDPLFRIAVLVRRERRQFRRQVATIVAVGAMATVLVAFNAAAISAWLAADVARVAGVLAVATAAVWTLPGSVPSALRGVMLVWVARLMRIVSRPFVG